MARSEAAPLSLADPGAACGCCGGVETPHAQRRRQILKAAQVCFARSGFHGASMQEICAEAQMSPGGLYRYFRSKDEMIDAIAEDERARAMRLLAELTGPGDLIDRLVGVALACIADADRPGGAALMAEVYAEGLRNSAIAAKFRSVEDDAHRVVHAFLAEQVAAGRIAPLVDLEAVLEFMGGVLDGVIMRRAVEPSLTPERIAPLLRAVSTALLRPVGGRDDTADDTGGAPGAATTDDTNERPNP